MILPTHTQETSNTRPPLVTYLRKKLLPSCFTKNRHFMFVKKTIKDYSIKILFAINEKITNTDEKVKSYIILGSMLFTYTAYQNPQVIFDLPAAFLGIACLGISFFLFTSGFINLQQLVYANNNQKKAENGHYEIIYNNGSVRSLKLTE